MHESEKNKTEKNLKMINGNKLKNKLIKKSYWPRVKVRGNSDSKNKNNNW